VDTLTASWIANMKGNAATVSRVQRDPDPAGLRPMAVGGLARRGRQVRAAGKWYRTAIPRAEQLYDDYLAEPPDLGGYPVPHAQRDSIGR